MIECPYCKNEQSDPDDLQDSEEGDVECEACGKDFTVTATVELSYSACCKKGRHKAASNPTDFKFNLAAFGGDKVWCEHCGDIVERADCE